MHFEIIKYKCVIVISNRLYTYSMRLWVQDFIYIQDMCCWNILQFHFIEIVCSILVSSQITFDRGHSVLNSSVQLFVNKILFWTSIFNLLKEETCLLQHNFHKIEYITKMNIVWKYFFFFTYFPFDMHLILHYK